MHNIPFGNDIFGNLFLILTLVFVKATLLSPYPCSWASVVFKEVCEDF